MMPGWDELGTKFLSNTALFIFCHNSVAVSAEIRVPFE